MERHQYKPTWRGKNNRAVLTWKYVDPGIHVRGSWLHVMTEFWTCRLPSVAVLSLPPQPWWLRCRLGRKGKEGSTLIPLTKHEGLGACIHLCDGRGPLWCAGGTMLGLPFPTDGKTSVQTHLAW